jgi:prolyl oligopeptidase
LNGKKLLDVPLPIGSIDSVTGRKKDTQFFFKLGSFLNPGVTYRYDFGSARLSVVRETQLSVSILPENFITEQIFYESKDGTKIPMFLIRKKVTHHWNIPS